MPASTLALGGAAYTLLEALDGSHTKVATATRSGTTQTIQAFTRGGLIDGVGILGDGTTTLNVADRSLGLTFNDRDAAGTNPAVAAGASINLLANADSAVLGLGGGNNRINTARDLINSQIQALDGADTVRIGGKADNSFVALGAGNDQFTATLASGNLDVVMGAGDDTALFLGALTAGSGSVAAWRANQDPNAGSNIVDMGAGNDRATFLAGVQGGEPGQSGYEVQLGAGNDTMVFGGNSSSNGFVLDTGTGSDSVSLGRNTSNAAINLGWDDGGTTLLPSGDSVVLGVGATLSDSAINSGQSSDTLRLGGTVTDTSLDLGWGNSLVDVNGSAGFGTSDTTVWDLGGGNDTLNFGALSDLSQLGSGSGFISLGQGADSLSLLGSGYSAVGAIEFDLGNDGDQDTIVFGIGSSYAGFTISNFGSNDILFIGAGSYGYGYQFLNEFANEFDLSSFQQAGNVIWSQDPDAGSSQQSLMTLNQDLFTDSYPDDGYLETVSATDGTTIQANESVVNELSDPSLWSSAPFAPMSQDSPDTPIFPSERTRFN